MTVRNRGRNNSLKQTEATASRNSGIYITTAAVAPVLTSGAFTVCLSYLSGSMQSQRQSAAVMDVVPQSIIGKPIAKCIVSSRNGGLLILTSLSTVPIRLLAKCHPESFFVLTLVRRKNMHFHSGWSTVKKKSCHIVQVIIIYVENTTVGFYSSFDKVEFPDTKTSFYAGFLCTSNFCTFLYTT